MTSRVNGDLLLHILQIMRHDVVVQNVFLIVVKSLCATHLGAQRLLVLVQPNLVTILVGVS